MKRKIKSNIQEILRSNKDYSSLNKDELVVQYKLIMNQYNEFKNKMINSIEHRFTTSKLEDIKTKQISLQEKMYRKALSELDSHLSILKNLINKN
ncbi:MAG: hypothetical protein ACOC3V_01930 [bacterium]